SELESSELLVKVLARPLDQARVDGLAEVDEALGHPTRVGDDDDEDDVWLEENDLDPPDDGRLERRRRDEREEVRHLRQRIGGDLQSRVDLAAKLGEVERRRGVARRRLDRLDHAVDEEAVPQVGWNAAGRSV